MIRPLLGAAALSCLLASPAAATVVYEVRIPTLYGGADQASVSGTITTDGTLGEIDDAAITAWSLTFAGTGGVSVTLSDADGALGDAYIFAWGLLATPDALYLSADLSPYMELGYDDGDYATDAYLQISSGQWQFHFNQPGTSFWTYGDALPGELGEGYLLVGEAQAAAVPLPAAAGLLGAALAGLGLVARRRA
ncbi:VPLPA-CTERM sorting domain-containing protein [Albimonas sp. CAU 1670]|uniref:VPLPA-CTERM sorting domain-containing protein n=1 Tax=Albimonas sp. CAU 1670 TaxID=3032599 RepID=UPI0023D9E166|nr:VPLPA-CTERM sorting domain-containing protein [Albimonas sp. CAU 1670]MDF2231844.1 VPLPA-CTERM sorting domain-containing protein [Albimonas sp. CAU 1670]